MSEIRMISLSLSLNPARREQQLPDVQSSILSKLDFNDPYWTCPFLVIQDLLIDLFNYGEKGFLKFHDFRELINLENIFYLDPESEQKLDFFTNYNAVYLFPKMVDIIHKEASKLILILRET